MRKSGKVINIEKNKVYILTSDNEFIKVKKHKTKPIIGETYVGETINKYTFLIYIFATILIISFVFILSRFHLKNTSNMEIVSDMNCSIKLNVNTYNEIVEATGISSGGIKISQTIDLKGKSLNEGLSLILNESIKNKYLTKAHADDGRKIVLFVCKNNDNKPINVDKFKKYALTRNFNIIVNNNISK